MSTTAGAVDLGQLTGRGGRGGRTGPVGKLHLCDRPRTFRASRGADRVRRPPGLTVATAVEGPTPARRTTLIVNGRRKVIIMTSVAL